MSRRATGFTLMELLVAMMLAGVVMTAVYKMLAGNQRFYRAQSQIVEVQQNIRAVTQILPAELRELSTRGGDLLAMDDTSMDMRSMRGFGLVCVTPNVGAGQIVLRNADIYLPTALDVTRHGLLIFREGDSTKATDDRWLLASITSTTNQNCTDGRPGTRLTISVTGGNTQLDSVPVGAPVRIWERVNYTLWTDPNRQWWLAVRPYANGAFGAYSAVAGPLAPSKGLWFTYYDRTGAVTAIPDSVRLVDITARGLSTQPISIQGRAPGQYADSVTVRVTLRNN